MGTFGGLRGLKGVLKGPHFESLLRPLMCYFGNIWGLRGLKRGPKIIYRGFGTKSPLLDLPGERAPIGPGDPLDTYRV